METANNGAKSKRSLVKTNGSASPSFRLRCPSLNSIRLRRTFDLFDKNGDGVITVEELGHALNVLGLDAEVSELDSMVSSHITPGKAGLQFEDFESLHRSLNDVFFGIGDNVLEESEEEMGKACQDETELSEAFKVFDENGDGYISARELQAVLVKLGLAEGQEISRVEKMISSVDRNQDGRVDFFEFKDMMRSITVRSA
ncbi:calcium-binding protein CML42 [Diospyros lotus]|uniref:calcium-binding protein CML42 n=1 Tax=Diospyros lotus TaxID=55363 RepID=UPI00225B8494|nr:calcium-binding protein CML42 [Diospyros lotus]